MSDLSWQEKAFCAVDQKDILKLFYPPDEEEIEEGAEDYTAYGKKVCAACPVRLQCLQYALDNEERFGIWGGSDEVERKHALSIDSYGKPVNRVRPISCPNCKNNDINTIDTKKLKTHLQCGTCQLEWWSRRVPDITPLVDTDIDDMET